MSIFKDRFEVVPGQNGSFVVLRGSQQHGRMSGIEYGYGFTNLADLMAWLAQQADAMGTPESRVAEVSIADVAAKAASEAVASMSIQLEGAAVSEGWRKVMPDGSVQYRTKPSGQLPQAEGGAASAPVDHMAAVRDSVARD